MFKRTLLFLLVIQLGCINAYSQTDSVTDRKSSPSYHLKDSAALARYYFKTDSIRVVKDSIAAKQDSIRMIYLKPLKPNGPNKFLDSLLKLYTVADLNFAGRSKQFHKKLNRFHEGKLRPKGQGWVFFMIILLILSFALLNKAFSREIVTIIMAFYSNMVKDDALFKSWLFLMLYVVFGFTVGMFLYLCAQYYHATFNYSGISEFIALSLAVLILFTAKLIVLKALAFLFDIQSLVKEYVSILYLGYFNASLLLLPLIVAFSLSPLRFAETYIYLALGILMLIFAIQVFRIGANILSKYKVSKTYLFIYLCALEVCPVLIVIKAFS